MASDEQHKPVRALLGLLTVMSRRRIGQVRHADIAAATAIGVTRLQRLAGTWRPHLPCPALDIVEAAALARFSAPVLDVDERTIARWLCAVADGREKTACVSAVRRVAAAAVERHVELDDVPLPDGLRELLGLP